MLRVCSVWSLRCKKGIAYAKKTWRMHISMFLYTKNRRNYTFSFGRKLVLVPMSMFGLIPGPALICKLIKGSNLSFETPYDNSHKLFRRFIGFGQQYERNIYGKRLWDFPNVTSRFCDNPDGSYLLKVKNRNTRTRCEICSKLTTKTPEWRRSGVFIANSKHISHLILVFLLLTLNM